MRQLTIWLLILAVVAGLASATVAAIVYWPRRAGPKYTTAKVTLGRVETVVNSTGKVKAVKSVSVGAFTSGPIDKVYVDFNSEVRKGLDSGDYPLMGTAIAGLCGLPLAQSHLSSAGLLFPDKTLLAEIDPRLALTKVKQDRAFLETQIADQARLQAQLDEARNNAKRADALQNINDSYISRAEWDEKHFSFVRSLAQLKLAKASVDQARASLENSEANLAYTKIWSTENGIVVERKVDPGQTVAASFQTPELFIIAADMDKQMHVYGSVDEADIGLITSAQARQQKLGKSAGLASFTVDAYPGELFQGKIFQIRNNSTTEQNVVTYPVVVETTNPGGKLRPNMTATITFNIDAKDNVLRVPVAALRFIPTSAQARPEDRHYLEVPLAGSAKRSVTEKVDLARQRQHRIVWVEDGPYLRAVPVTLGLIDRQFAELIEGDLTDGQSVVTNIDTTAR